MSMVMDTGKSLANLLCTQKICKEWMDKEGSVFRFIGIIQRKFSENKIIPTNSAYYVMLTEKRASVRNACFN